MSTPVERIDRIAPMTNNETTRGDGDDIEITCPSGLRGRIRGLKGKDFRLFNRQSAKTGEGVTKILNAVWGETLDPGIYKPDSTGRVNFADVLVGDRFYGIMGIRMAMYPPGSEEETYKFKVNCKDCRSPIAWEVMLNDLPVKRLPAASAEKLRAGTNEFELLLGETRIWFALQNGRAQARAHRLIQHAIKRAERGQKPADVVLSLASRIVRINGIDIDDVDEMEAFDQKVAWLEELSGPMHRKLLKGLDAADCGVETSIEIECTECFATQEVELPFDATFLFPK